MIYILLTKEKISFQLEIQKNIINYLKNYLSNNSNIQYKIIYCPLHIIEKNLSEIGKDDYVLFHPFVAANNLLIVKKYQNSVVILRHKTILIQKISKRNQINENLAINNGFKILYMEPEYDDITNDSYKLIVQPEEYLISIQTILNKISG